MRKISALVVIILLLGSINVIAYSSRVTNKMSDFDPLVDVEVTVEIETIRLLEQEVVTPIFRSFRIFRSLVREVSLDDTPDFYVKVFINNQEYVSDILGSSKYLYDISWGATLNVPDEEEFVDIKIQLWDSTTGGNSGGAICDISPDSGTTDDSYDVELSYSIKTGHWTGDDELSDASGYGRLCGTDDGSIYQDDKDCELWFNIYQNDYDNDGIPYWQEENTYQTNPEVANSGDPDNDNIPVEWEWKWGYNPFEAESHETLDADKDSINNYEEYLTSEWFSDPFRKDVFVEMDIMEEGPNGEKTYYPEISEEYITTAFNRQNIIFHLDMGDMGGHDLVPFDGEIGRGDLNDIYYDYFLHGDENTWRRGVFHYGLVVHEEDPPGYMFRSNSFQIASVGMEDKAGNPTLQRDIVYASAYMHELGHTFAFNPIPGHDPFSKYPWQIGWWANRPYKSVMNYAWMYQMVDYSDGSRGSPDLDDWERMNYYSFEHEWG